MHSAELAHLSFWMVPLAIARGPWAVDTELMCPLATPVRLPSTDGPWTRANPQQEVHFTAFTGHESAHMLAGS